MWEGRITQEQGTVGPIPAIAGSLAGLLQGLAGLAGKLAGEVPLHALDSVLSGVLQLLGGSSGLHHKLALQGHTLC